jgi:hypothetical protein
MALFTVTDQAGRLVKLVRAPNGDEPTARELAAGKGKGRDERFLGHDGGFVVSQVDHDGGDKVLWQDEAASDATEGSPAAGDLPVNRGRK